MQWTVQVIVVLLNVAWIFFFLQPDPFSVSVQRRSSERSDEEMLFRQFCIQPHPDMNWTPTVHSANLTSNKTSSTNTTAEEKTELSLNEVHVINKTETQHDCNNCNEFRPPAQGYKPVMRLPEEWDSEMAAVLLLLHLSPPTVKVKKAGKMSAPELLGV
ncbi:hypothetical protein GBF38_005551 [Nibea albiflora]|uniref:Uncharacterized protein n=1 Tax=Nibea albiflora TaxID=240163 RepID=A0ACB7EX30_NIBAL|nr:hypothetical protein GBF38_005551 [Nibea albiflora]